MLHPFGQADERGLSLSQLAHDAAHSVPPLAGLRVGRLLAGLDALFLGAERDVVAPADRIAVATADPVATPLRVVVPDDCGAFAELTGFLGLLGATRITLAACKCQEKDARRNNELPAHQRQDQISEPHFVRTSASASSSRWPE